MKTFLQYLKEVSLDTFIVDIESGDDPGSRQQQVKTDILDNPGDNRRRKFKKMKVDFSKK